MLNAAEKRQKGLFSGLLLKRKILQACGRRRRWTYYPMAVIAIREKKNKTRQAKFSQKQRDKPAKSRHTSCVNFSYLSK